MLQKLWFRDLYISKSMLEVMIMIIMLNYDLRVNLGIGFDGKSNCYVDYAITRVLMR